MCSGAFVEWSRWAAFVSGCFGSQTGETSSFGRMGRGMRFVFRAVSGVTSAVFRHGGCCKAGMRTTRRFGGAVSETSGMNATPTAGRSLKDRLMQRRMSSTLVMHELKVTERLVRVAGSDFVFWHRVARHGAQQRTPRSEGAPWRGTKPKRASGSSSVATLVRDNGLIDGARP